MAIEVTLPRQGWSMEEAVFVEWIKHDGETVKAGEPLFSVETEKAVQEVESLDEGILRLTPRSPQKGDTVRVADVLGYLVAVGEATPSEKAAAPQVGTPLRGVRSDGSENRPYPERGDNQVGTAVPAVRGRLGEASLPQAATCRPVSPRAARRAMQEGVDLRAVSGTGKGGRIRESDVVAAIQGRAAAPTPVALAPATPAVPAVPPIPGRDEKVTTLRRTVADRMHRSKTITAPVTLTTRVDAGALVTLRDGLKAKANGKPVPTFGDIIMREVAQALLAQPALNARWEGDHIRFPDSVNIGFAVDTEAGLVVPVVRDTPKHTLQELADLTRDLAERAKARRLSAEEMTGGTFTITNLGMAGIDAFTPIVNWPECAVLGVGRITEEPVVNGKKLAIGHRMWLSLTFDHRIVDGAPAARFLETLSRKIETVA